MGVKNAEITPPKVANLQLTGPVTWNPPGRASPQFAFARNR